MTPCPACGETAFRPASRRWGEQTRLSIGSSRESAARVELERCARCGLLRQSEPAASRDLAALYEQLEDPLYEQEEPGRRRSFEVAMRRLGPHLPAPGRLLDIGCATGLFLEIAASRGWVVEGVEPSAWACERARRSGMLVTQGFFEDLPPPARPFDVVTMWDVLEHVPDPARAVAKAAEILRPGGVLVVNVPAADSVIARLLGKRWPLLLSEHLHYFTRRSVERLFSSRGFDTLGYMTHPVFFGIEYVSRRLAQHGLAPRAVSTVIRKVGLSDVSVPLLMGEFTVVARRAG